MNPKKLLVTIALFGMGYLYRGCAEGPETLGNRLYKRVQADPARYERVIDLTSRRLATLKAEAHWSHPARPSCLDPKYARFEWGEEAGRDFAYLRLTGPAQGAYLLRLRGDQPALERIVEVAPARIREHEPPQEEGSN